MGSTPTERAIRMEGFPDLSKSLISIQIAIPPFGGASPSEGALNKKTALDTEMVFCYQKSYIIIYIIIYINFLLKNIPYIV